MNDEFAKQTASLFEQIGESRKMVLSTSINDNVTSRMMSVIIFNGIFYFQTDQTFRKYEQLQKNSKAALCIDNFQIEGTCKEMGNPLKHDFFCKLYEKYFPFSYTRYTSLSNERLFALEPTYIKKWIYEEGEPFEEIFDFFKREYRKLAYIGG